MKHYSINRNNLAAILSNKDILFFIPWATKYFNITRYLSNKAKSVESLKSIVENYKILEINNKTVFAEGNYKKGVILIGEAPGYHENKTGIPFCGQSGRLLNNIFNIINLDRNKYYITNVFFWRPDKNRKPNRNEILICKPFIEKHILLVKPKLIVLIGKTSVESLLNLKISMKKLKRKSILYKNYYLVNKIRAFIILHPAYILRRNQYKKVIYQDILNIKKHLNY